MDQKIDVGKLRLGKERVYFVLTLIVATIMWGWLLIGTFQPNLFDEFNKNQETETEKTETTEETDVFSQVFTPNYLLYFFIFGFFSHFLAMAYIRLNGVKVGPDQFPEIWEAIEKLSKKTGLDKPPSTFVVNGQGLLNAFAARLVFRRIMVLYSDLVEALVDDKDQAQLEAVIAHELGHHALNHTGFKEWYLISSELMPVFSLALSRSREFSADRVMLAATGNLAASERALAKLAAGRILGRVVNIPAFVSQLRDEGGFFEWLAEKLATHPHLPKRIKAIEELAQRTEQVASVKENETL